MMKTNIFIAGASGSGKTSSLRNLDPNTTIILNTEGKALPFRNAKSFRMNASVKNLTEFYALIKRAAENKECTTIIIDSFTSLSEQALAHCKANFKGFDQYKEYNSIIYDIIQNTKHIDKTIVFIGIDEPLQDDNGTVTRCVRVDGKALKGSIEKEFSIVLWSVVKHEDGVTRHLFETNNIGETTAKTPMGMFETRYIENDLNSVLTEINDYYKE